MDTETDLNEPAGPVTAVVGIGASAGGLEALEAVFATAPVNAGLSYVVVTHLSPNFKSLMDELLSRHTSMKVRLVEDGMLIRPNEVYVIPPNSEMIVVSGRLLLSDQEPGPPISSPIDTFFRSLAREYAEQAVAVILSGTGGDGSHALEAVRDAGGKVFVQTPESAKFDGIPNAAIRTGQADEVLVPSDIGRRLQNLGSEVSGDLPDQLLKDPNPENVAMSRVFAALFGSSSIDFEAYKSSTVLRRIDRRIGSTRVGDVVSYANLIENDPTEAESLSRDLLIGVTHFFRDDAAFRKLGEDIIASIVRESRPDRPIRIWSLGCATGEEAYSVAMLLRNEIDRAGLDRKVQIFATDLQRDFIDQAGRGIFARSAFPEEWKHIWGPHTFENGKDQLQISPEVRRMVVFAHHNALADPPFTRLDLVSCRNMLIYLQPDAQERVLGHITFGLRRGGYLFLGPSETLGEADGSFSTIEKRWRIYRKDRGSGAFHVPNRLMLPEKPDRPNTRVVIRRPPASREETQTLPAYAAMLERFAPPGMLVDGQRQLVHTFGAARNFLRPPEGAASLDILRMVPEGLQLPIATAIDRVNREGREVRYEGASTGGMSLNLTVFPTESGVEGRRGHKVILLEEDGQAAGSPDQAEVLDASSIAVARIDDLEDELRYTRESLEATIEELETSNRELQSTNEELMAANEELQSTNEELHSVNEELYSVNADYQRKNDELIQLNRDMEALMSATDVGVVFVDEDLAIRRFTEPARRIFNLIPEDKGRDLSHMTHRLVDVDMVELARMAVDQFKSSVLEAMDSEGRWSLLRCIPMRTPGSAAIGAIITVFDIDELRRAKQEAEQQAKQNSLIKEIGNALVVTSDSDLSIRDHCPGWASFTGQTHAEYRDRGWLEAIHPKDRARISSAGDAADDGVMTTRHQLIYRLYNQETGEYRHCQAYLTPENDTDGNLTGWTSVIMDVENAVQSEQAVRRSEQLIRSIIDDMPGLFAMLDADRKYIFANARYEKRWGGKQGLAGRKVNDVLPPDVLSAVGVYLEAAYRGEHQDFMFERRNDSGKLEIILGIYAPTFGPDGSVSGVSVFAQNIVNSISNLRDKQTMEEVLGRILIHGSDEYLVIDGESQTIMRSSKGATSNLRRSTVELSRLWLPDLLPEYDRARLQPLLENLRQDGNDALKLRTFVVRGDGTTYDAEIIIARDKANSDNRMAVTIKDLSEFNATQQAMRSRNEELARSNSDLESFAYFASHDLKEPVRKMGNFAELIATDLGDKLTEDGSEYLAIIRRASERMLARIQDLLNFSRVRAASENFTSVSLNNVLDALRQDLAPELKVIGAELKIGDLPEVYGDTSLLNQMFDNLIGNSIKYRAPERPLVIDVCAERDDEGWKISVKDNGIGFDMADAEQIFGLFQRLHGPTEIPGSGVGLAICKRVSELHGGSIVVDSEPGAGSCFTITLPA